MVLETGRNESVATSEKAFAMYVDELCGAAETIAGEGVFSGTLPGTAELESVDTVPSSVSDWALGSTRWSRSTVHTLRVEPEAPKPPPQLAPTTSVEDYADQCAQLIGNNPGTIRRADDGGAAFLHSVDAWHKVTFFHKPSSRWLTGKVRIRITLYPDAPKAVT